MRMSLCVRAAVTAGIALAGYMAPPTMSFGIVGVNSVGAAQFYTRKRINGVWVEGRFPKAGRTVRSASAARKADRTKTVRRVTEVPRSATLTALPPVDLRREATPTPMPTRTGTLRETKPAIGLPDVEAALVISAVGPVPPADETGLAAEGRVARLRRALEARADELKASSEVPSVAARVPVTAPATRVEKVAADAVEATTAASADRAGRAMSTGSVAEGQPATAPTGKLAPLVPRSVSYDFETGIKTTVYESSVVREPFDRAAMRGLAAAR